MLVKGGVLEVKLGNIPNKNGKKEINAIKFEKRKLDLQDYFSMYIRFGKTKD
jgi:hypothetical protein